MNNPTSIEESKPLQITKETPLTIENRSIKLHEFIDARGEEVSTFTSLLRTKLLNLNKTPCQLLPKHMRRRAMSHNRYRTPSKVRNKLKEDEFVLTKPLRCRRHLRKQTQLFSAYKRRSQGNTWLETHIWHAKRMKMKPYFGYKVAEKCWAKSGRAGFHFFKTDCLMYDLSYTEVLEIKSSSFEKVINSLKEIVDEKSSNWIQFTKNPIILKGTKSGSLDLFKPGDIPRRFLQNCDYIWIPRPHSSSEYKVWFFVHPGTSVELAQWHASSQENKEIEVNFHRESFNLFHILGPVSCFKLHSLLSKLAETPENIKKLEENPLISCMKLISDPGSYPKRFVQHFTFDPKALNKLCSVPKSSTGDQLGSSFENQGKYNDATVNLAMFEYETQSNLPELHMWHPSKPTDKKFIITTRSRHTHKKREYLKEMIKKRPQSKRKNRKARLEKSTEPEKPKKDIEPEEPKGKIVTENERDFEDEVTDARKSAIAKILEEEKAKPVELIIMHDHGEAQTSKGAGFKILVNGGKGLLVWRMLNYLSCKALGMREYHQVLCEMRVPIFPQDFASSVVYDKYEELSRKNKIETFFKKPPQKRINLIKIASPFGFGPEWNKLTSSSNTGDDLVPIYLRMTDSRIPANGAGIFIPTPEDLVQMKKDIREPVHTEPLNLMKFEKQLKKVAPEEYLNALNGVQVSRKLIGYLTTGYFSYRFGVACGKGYISKTFLNEIAEFKNAEKSNLHFEKTFSFDSSFDLILRNPTSRCYHSCKVYLISN